MITCSADFVMDLDRELNNVQYRSKKKKDMTRAFRCKECGTGYNTTGGDAPPSPNWSDGHVCEMVEVEAFLVDNVRYKAGERALGHMKLKKTQCQGHAIYSDEEEYRIQSRLEENGRR